MAAEATGFKNGDAIRIEAGALTEKNMISIVNGDSLVLDHGLRFEHFSGEDVVRLKEGEWSSTVTTAAVQRGARKVPVKSTASFATGQQVRIISDAGTEWDTVEVDSEHEHDLFLVDGLLSSHPAGAAVVGDEGVEQAKAEAPVPRSATRGAALATEWLESSSGSRLITETVLKRRAEGGDSSLEVACALGFQEGDFVRVEGEPREFSELLRVSRVDYDSRTLHLESTLGKAYPRGAAVAKEEEHILGEYGFLSQFDGITEDEARQRVRRLASLFGVREFEFYNAFKGYSSPPADHEEKWRCACFGTPVSRSVLRAYTDEIEKLGGRSWLTVVGMATDPGDTEAQRFTYVIGNQVVEGKGLLDAVEPTSELARNIAPHWARFAKGLGFSGIHWATVNGYASGGGAQKESDVKEFLRESSVALKQHGLEQTWNFLNGFGWDKPLVRDGVVAFTIWEPFDHMTDPFQALNAGVVKSFPVQEDEDFQGALDHLSEAWARARCFGMHILAVGDGSRLLRNDYYPSALNMTDTDIRLLTESVFGELACSEGEGQHGAGHATGGERARVEIQRGVMHATIGEAHGAQVGRDEYPMLEGMLTGLVGYSKCHVVAGQAIDEQHEETWAVRARRLTGEDTSLIEVPFEGLCDGNCVDGSSVTSSQVRDALQQVLERHSIQGRVESARINWGSHSRDHDHDHEFRALGIGGHNLKYIAICLLVVVALCLVIVFLELWWQRHAKAKEAAHHEAFSGVSRQDGAETDPLASGEDTFEEAQPRAAGPAPGNDDTTRTTEVVVEVEADRGVDQGRETQTTVHVTVEEDDRDDRRDV